MSSSWYNGYNWNQRAKILRALKRGDAGPDFSFANRPCAMCGDPDRPPGNWHSEDYSEPFLFEPPATFPVCNACHSRLHKRFARPAAEWELFCRHLEAGGYGREFTILHSAAQRRALSAALELGEDVDLDPIRERLSITLDCRILTLDPESLEAPWARPRPLRVRPGKDEFRQAIVEIQLSEHEWRILRYHARAPRRTVTMREIARHALNSSRPGAANLAYGKLAHRLGEQLDWEPDKREDGSPFWMSVVAEGWQPPSSAERPREFELVMIPTLVDLISELEPV